MAQRPSLQIQAVLNHNDARELERALQSLESAAAQAQEVFSRITLVWGDASREPLYTQQALDALCPAHISGITSYGIYCEIDENHCEGMIPLHDLDDDYYDFDERNYCLIGRRHRNKYQLGDAVNIKVARANIDKRQLDFTLVK